MKCTIKKEDLIAFIYEEIDEKKKRMIEEHIKNCPECAGEIAALKKDSNILQKWRVNVPEMDLKFSGEKPAVIPSGKNRSLKTRVLRTGSMFAAAAAIILVVLSLLNFKVEYDGSGFSVSMSLWGRGDDVQITEDLLAKLEDNQRRTEEFILQAVAVSEERMRVERLKITSELIDSIQKQRAVDMVTIGENMEYLHTYAAEGFRQNSEILGELYQLTKTNLSR